MREANSAMPLLRTSRTLRRIREAALTSLAIGLVILTSPGPVHAGATETPAAAEPAPSAPAQQPPAAPVPPPLSPAELEALEEIRAPALNLKTTIETLEKAVDRNRENDEELGLVRLDVEGLIEGAELTAQNLAPRIEALNRQIDKLGPPPAKDAPPEAAQVAEERARLSTLVAEVNGALKTTELVQVRARQLYVELQKLRQGIFTTQMLRRSPSPLSPATWKQLGSELSGTGRQLGAVASAWLSAARERWIGLTGLLLATGLLYLSLRALVARLLAYRLVPDRVPPPSFFEQAATAGWVAPLLALPAVTAFALLGLGLDSLGLLLQEVQSIAAAAVPAFLIFVAVSALARAILQPRRAAWRLVDLADRPARTLTRILTRIAAVYGADMVLQETIRRLFLPLSISVLETALASIAIATLLIQLVRTPFEPKPQPPRETSPEAAAEPQGYELPQRGRLHPRLIKLPILALALAILALSLLGYIALGRFLAGQVVVTGSAIVIVLLFHLAIRALFGGPGTGLRALGTVLEEKAGLSAGQTGAITQVLFIVLNGALALLAAPLILVTWGYSLPESLSWLEALVFGFEIGEFRISLARILLAVVMFVGLLVATRIAQRWLDTGVLKSKSLDQGIANSIHTGVGYAGFLVAVLVAVSYGGLDVTNFAIVAGALSVGIGFGLQSIVNNFVSGLILLVERPIKVGDWVVVKGQEGYVRRIAVRSTEIETFDRASLIVPNSDLITSTVTNWTHRNALGRVVVRVGVSYRSDPEYVRDILQSVAKECPLILQHPPPSVGFDNFGPSALEFSLRATVPDVNKQGAVQTDLRLRIFKAFKAAGIEMPYNQFDVHLRDLDIVRQVLARVGAERAAKAAAAAAAGLRSETDDG